MEGEYVMTTKTMLRMGVLALALQGMLGCSAIAETPKKAAVDDASLGLSKTVIATEIDATPAVFEYGKGDPGSTVSLGASYLTAPPQIPHATADFMPITRDNNMCVACHNTPDMIGKKLDKGMAIPAPRSHYVNNTNELYMGRWTCTQCHRPQAEVQPLVVNTYKQ
jgi:cytochrome c-type protein NapB